MGFLPDANTVALWEQDDAKVPARITTTDLTGNYTFTADSDTLSPMVCGDPRRTQGVYGIGCGDTRDRRLNTAKSVELAATLKADFTFEFWLHVVSDTAGGTKNRYWITDWFAGSGTTAGLIAIGMGQDKWIVLYNQASGATIQEFYDSGPLLDEWQHGAITIEVSGSDRIIRAYLNGVQVGTSTKPNVDTAASTGTVNDLCLLEHPNGLGDRGNFIVSAVRLTDIVQTPAQLVINAARPDFDFPTDGDTIINLDFADVVPEIDCAVGGHPLTIGDISDTGFERFPERATPLIGALGTNFCRLYDDTVSMAYDGRATPPMIAAIHSGNWSFETWVSLQGQGDRDRGIFMMAGNETLGTGGSTANWQLAIEFDLGSNGEHFIQVLWEEGTGTVRTTIGTVPFVTNDFLAPAGEEFNIAHHLGISAENIGGVITLRFYRDGVIIETIATGFGPAVGGEDTHRFRMGTNDVSVEARCMLQHTMISDVTRDDAWFLASFNEGIALAGAGAGHRDFPPLPKVAFP